MKGYPSDDKRVKWTFGYTSKEREREKERFSIKGFDISKAGHRTQPLSLLAHMMVYHAEAIAGQSASSEAIPQ